MMRKSRLPAAALGMLLVPLAAQAQWSPSATLDLGMGYGQMALSQSALDGARRLSSDSSKAFQSQASQWKEPEFDPGFEADPGLTDTVNQRFVLFYGGDDPASRATMARELASGRYHDRFRDVMRRHGLEPRLDDLLEVAAARYVALWEIIHGRDITPAQARAVRAQLLAQFSEDFWMRRMDDAEKQELAETFVLHVAAADLAHEALVERDDPELLARYRAGVQDTLLPDGPRLDRLTISDTGFVSR